MSNVIANQGLIWREPPEQVGVAASVAGALLTFSDGTTAPVASAPHTPTNAQDPVSPQRDSACVGVVPPQVPAGILHAFPNDPSLVPVYYGPPQTP